MFLDFFQQRVNVIHKKENIPASGNVKMEMSWRHHSAPAMLGPTVLAIKSEENP